MNDLQMDRWRFPKLEVPQIIQNETLVGLKPMVFGSPYLKKPLNGPCFFSQDSDKEALLATATTPATTAPAATNGAAAEVKGHRAGPNGGMGFVWILLNPWNLKNYRTG